MSKGAYTYANSNRLVKQTSKVLCHNIDVLVHAAIEYGFDVDRLIKGMDTPRAAAEG